MKRQSSIALLLALAALAPASSALALFDVAVLSGRRWYSLDPKDGEKPRGVASQEFDITAHANALTGAPVAVGANIAVANLNKQDLGGATTATGFQIGIDIFEIGRAHV